MRARRLRVALILACGVIVSSCASINVNALPSPGDAYRDGYDIVIAFNNALNLPARAKVVLDGKTVGVVTNVAGTARQVDVTARISASVALPQNIQASLQQATVLGDLYVALDRNKSDQPANGILRSGGRIPLAQTTSPPQLEDTIAHLANFITSGSIERVQEAIVGLNRVTPQGDGAVRKLASQVAADLSGLSDNIDVVDQLLNNASATAEAVHNRIPAYQDLFSPQGLLGMYRMQVETSYLSEAIPSIGSIFRGGYWLVPLLTSLANTMGALQHSKWAFEEEYPAWQKLFTDFFLPQDQHPAINITSIVGPDGRELSGNVQDVLRILGASP
ncbi:MlaD family protein [Mycobacterium marseillense]|uniref:MlaD family protein n=1 Tax=Mycobacterium marseillense TaxID=701042 RepID=UPI0015D35DDB|nr:MlaD family protein [Mycobacterium marseillense]MCV7406373.1 MCE family protein [Mycobacterium marseillense]